MRVSHVEIATTDYQSVLARPDIDAVSVCLPNWLHAKISIEAIQAGKHVLCEKPLANTLVDGERLAAAVHASDRIFMLALNNRFRVEIQSLKRVIDAGTLGDIYYAKTGWVRRRWATIVRGWFMEKEKSGGGPLIDLGVHMLDLALWLMGSPKATRVSGVVYDKLAKEMEPLLGPLDIEDLGAAMVHLDNGAAIYSGNLMGRLYRAREHLHRIARHTRRREIPALGPRSADRAAGPAVPTLHDDRRRADQRHPDAHHPDAGGDAARLLRE